MRSWKRIHWCLEHRLEPQCDYNDELSQQLSVLLAAGGDGEGKTSDNEDGGRESVEGR